MPIFRRKNCIHAASGIFALCKRLHSTLVESGNRVTKILLMNKENCALNRGNFDRSHPVVYCDSIVIYLVNSTTIYIGNQY